jgi:hypothetical protein
MESPRIIFTVRQDPHNVNEDTQLPSNLLDDPPFPTQVNASVRHPLAPGLQTPAQPLPEAPKPIPTRVY